MAVATEVHERPTAPPAVPAERVVAERPLTNDHWSIPTLLDVYQARKTVSRYLRETPVLAPQALAARLGFSVHLKCENLQPTGAFKVRGGVNLLHQLRDHERALGVVTASTGNHGQSIAYAAGVFGAKATIYVPEGANPKKVAAMERLGANVVFAGHDFDACRLDAEAFATRTGSYFVHPANEPRLIAGVATYTLDMVETIPELDVLFVPTGGGSGLSGACIVGKTINPNLTIIGVQTTGAPAIYESWRRRALVELDHADTFAEGVATRVAFDLPARIIWPRVDHIDLVSDDDLWSAIVTILETTGMVVEGGGAASLAAAYHRRHELAGKQVGLILSGGNLTLDALRTALTREVSW